MNEEQVKTKLLRTVGLAFGDGNEADLILDERIDELEGMVAAVSKQEGPVGPKGDKGDRGEKGAQGVQGIAGNDGKGGIAGKDGATGQIGPSGAKGKDGANGKDGVNGLNGKDGINGSPDTPDQVVEKVNQSSLLIKKERVEGLLDAISRSIANGVSSAVGITTSVFFKNGTQIGRAKNINIVEGTGVTATMTQTGDQMNINLSAAGGAGTGNVTGPASATDNHIVAFDGATGTLIKDSGLTLSGTNTGDQSVASLSGTISLVGQTADIVDTAFAVNTAGIYRIEYYLLDTTADITAGAVTLNIKYTDNAAARTVSTTPTVLSATTAFSQGEMVVRLASGNVTYGTTHSGSYGTAAYALYLTQEKLL